VVFGVELFNTCDCKLSCLSSHFLCTNHSLKDDNGSLITPKPIYQGDIPIVEPEADGPIPGTFIPIPEDPEIHEPHTPDPNDQLMPPDLPVNIEPAKPVSEKPLILYAYSDGVDYEAQRNARTNFEFFLAHGLHAAADFVFIFNGKTDAVSLVPEAENIRIVERANDCYDIGAYAEVLTANDFYKGYKKFIMLNASIRGPFVPYWASSCWTDMYLNRVTDEVKVCLPSKRTCRIANTNQYHSSSV
jgi:hypothetical protein